MAGNERKTDEQPQLVTACDGQDDFEIKGSANKNNIPCSDICTICLEPVTERAVVVPCNHLSFDFLCLISWLQEKASCPLCKAPVTKVQYKWSGPDDFETYDVSELKKPGRSSSSSTRGSRRAYLRRAFPRRTPETEQIPAAGEDPALERRRRVYRNRLFCLHIGANRISQYRDFTATGFASSSDLQSRARAFLRRELKVFSFLDSASRPRGCNRDFLVEYIVAILKTNDPKGANGVAEELLSEFLGTENARLLLHELEAFLKSPYMTLVGWDKHVRYPDVTTFSAK